MRPRAGRFLRPRRLLPGPAWAVLCVLVDEYGLPKVREALARYGEVLDAGVDATAP